MKYEALAKEIVEKVGGRDNVSSLSHCITRLRFILKDESKADMKAIKAIDGVGGCVSQSGQFQVIIGTHVEDVYDVVMEVGGIGPSNSADAPKKGGSPFAKLIDVVAGCFTPVVGALAGSGMIKAILSLCSVLGWMDTSGQTYYLLNLIADSVFYFLPFILAVSAAAKFRTNQYIALAIAGVLLHPNLMALKTAGDPVHFFGVIPVTMASYASSVVPILLIVWFQSYVERFAKKISPKMIRIFFVPTLVILITAFAGLVVLGPLGAIIGEWMAKFFLLLESYGGWISPTLIGALCPLLVMTGMHHSLTPVRMSQLATFGYETFLIPGMLVSNVAQGASSLAVALKAKNKDTKSVAATSGATALLGITEPALYGVNLRFKRPLYAAMIGGGIGGFYVGLMGVRNYASGGYTLLGLPTYIGDGNLYSLTHEVIGVLIGFVISFGVAYFLGIHEEEDGVEEQPLTESKPAGSTMILQAPISGTTVALSEVKDEVFSSEMMGKGLAIAPAEGRVVSPVNGTVSMIFATKHAIGLLSEDGVEVLIHIGMDTVQLNGEHFLAHVKQGDNVKIGDLLIEFDKDAIASKGYDTVTPIIITNSAQYADVFGNPNEAIQEGADFLSVLS